MNTNKHKRTIILKLREPNKEGFLELVDFNSSHFELTEVVLSNSLSNLLLYENVLCFFV
jgi:hypothetical protein